MTEDSFYSIFSQNLIRINFVVRKIQRYFLSNKNVPQEIPPPPPW